MSTMVENIEKSFAIRCDIRCFVLCITKGIIVTHKEVESNNPPIVAKILSSLDEI